MPRASSRASGPGQRGRCPKFFGTLGGARRCSTRSGPSRKRARSAWATRPPSFSARASPAWAESASSSARFAFACSSSRAACGVEGVRGGEGLEVPLLEEHPRQAPQRRALSPAAQPLEGNPAVERLDQDVVPVGEALAQPLLPGLGEEQVGLRLVRHAEAGDHPALEGPLLEDRGAQGVDGADAGALEDLEGGPPPARAPPRSGPGSTRTASSRSRSRSFIVVAAFSVKVTAAISSSRASPERTRDSIRSTRRVVLPVPAPASITRLVAWSLRARSRASSSTGRKLIPRPSAAGRTGASRRGS